jgi:pimeloyl-ACP methyl ester carboxylesterase
VIGLTLLVAALAAPIRDSAIVESDGARLFLDIRGADSTSPVVLVLHGGPGDGQNGLLSFISYAGVGLEQRFVMVYLYQRGVMKSPAVPTASQTIAQHVRDVDRAVDYLGRRFHQDRVRLIGHSWGGLLAGEYLLAHPDKVAAWVAVAAPLSLRETDSLGYRITLGWAEETRNAEALEALRAIGPPPWGMDKLLVERRWASTANGGIGRRFDLAQVLRDAGMTAPDSAATATTIDIAMAMLPEISAADLGPSVGRMRIPVLFMAGGRDAIVPPAAMAVGYQRYGGPRRMTVFEDSHHLLFVDEPERFVREVTAFFMSPPK